MVSGLFILHNIRNGEGVGGRDVGAISTGDPRVPTRILGIRPAAGPDGRIHIHPRTSAPRLAAFLGAWVHGGTPDTITLRCMVQPTVEFVRLSVGTEEHTRKWLYVSVRDHAEHSSPWIEREAAHRLFVWLTEWMTVETDPIYRKPLGAYTSEEEYQQCERPRYHCPDPETDDVE